LERNVIDLGQYHVWFVVGSQDLYGDDALAQVADHTKQLVATLDAVDTLPIPIVAKPVLKTADAITETMQAANADPLCVGVIAWMHTFSPAKMWTPGLRALRRPLLHLHTQFNRDIPWATIDMDFMNLNQSAHGDREFGYICTRLGINRKVVVGHYENPDVHTRIAAWMRAAAANRDAQTIRIARLGDNMRRVAVTEGDKVEAERVFGYQVDYYGVGDLVEHVSATTDAQIDELCDIYADSYVLAGELRDGGDRRDALREAARIEAGMRALLADRNAHVVTDTFEDLHGLRQLPGISAQRLMADGYGFGAEGDWKTAGLVRAMKVMASGLPGGTSFMEDYTYHFEPGNEIILGAHMLEICPTIAADQPRVEVHPLEIGGREDPVRLVFTAPPGPAVTASLIDMGDGFRMVINEVDAVEALADLPRLPVARALWRPRPDLATAAECWIQAGGAHHTSYSYAVTTEMLRDYATITGIDTLVIDEHTRADAFIDGLRNGRRR
jgi:L-arabinose isomerase